MRDRRREILDRLKVIAVEALGASERVLINRRDGILPEDPRPAILINDGDEVDATPEGSDGPKRFYPNPLLRLSPEIAIYVDGRAPGDAERQLDALRVKLIAAILSDATLQAICAPSGDLRLEGYGVRDAMGRLLIGEAGLAFAFTYPLRLDELVETP